MIYVHFNKQKSLKIEEMTFHMRLGLVYLNYLINTTIKMKIYLRLVNVI